MEYTLFILISIIISILIYRRHDMSMDYSYTKYKTKEKRKAFVVEYLRHHPQITNHELREFVNISDPTATRYFEELGSEKKIKKVGKRGRGVYYVLNK